MLASIPSIHRCRERTLRTCGNYMSSRDLLCKRLLRHRRRDERQYQYIELVDSTEEVRECLAQYR